MTDLDADAFFTRYAAALLARDAAGLAALYAVPSLILFPGRSIAVGDAAQTKEFFAGSFDQYTGVDAMELELSIMARTDHSVWADVTWSYDGQPRERFCYQLVAGTDGPQIAVLTPLDLASPRP